MGGVKRRLDVLFARGVNAIEMRQDDRAPRLVEGRHRVQPVSKAADHSLGIALERVGRRACRPAAVSHQQQRQIPVIERGKGLDAAGLAAIHQPVIEIQALLIQRTDSIRIDTRPGDGEAISFDAELLDQVQIFVKAIVMVAGHVAIVAIVNPTGHVGESVPNGGLAAVSLARTFDLERGSGDAENKISRETGDEKLGIHERASNLDARCRPRNIID